MTVVQGSPEWFASRCGLVTASRIADIVARTKSGWSTSRANYMAELVAERLTGKVNDGFTSAAMQWGTDNEPVARLHYEFMTNETVTEIGFVKHPTIGDTGASPDGLVGDNGLVEIKCPITATHIDTLLGQMVPAKYQTQMQWQMACTGRQWCDFVSFDPRMPESMQLFLARVPRDAERITELETHVIEFLNELRQTVDRLRSKYEPQTPTEAELITMAG